MSYILSTDATLDLPLEMVNEYGIEVVPMAFNLDGEEILQYPDERGISNEDFYEALKNGKLSKTSQINPMMYVDCFTPILERGEDIFHIAFTSGLSGTYQSALLAKDMLADDFPDRRIEVVDSLCASAGQGYLVYLAAKRKAEGMEMDELINWTVEHRLRVAHVFTVDDLFHLNRGGRLSTAEAIVGTALKIKPIIGVDTEGKLFVENKVRGNKKAMDYMINQILELKDADEDFIMVGHGAALERAEELKEKIIAATGLTEIPITKIGPVIGSHTGPGMLAVLFMKKQ